MTQLSIQQYQEAISNALIRRHIEVLQILYVQPNSTSTAKGLAELIHPSNPAPITASGRIGKIGKAIAEYCKVVPANYFDGSSEKPAYFTVISDFYQPKIGWTMHNNLRLALENLQLVNKNRNEITERLTTEFQPFEETKLFSEGKLLQVLVDKFERNQNARIACIKHYGDKCCICGFDFGKVYGEIANGYIHVHHKSQLSEIKKEYEVNPIEDLIPVCPNCHAVIHLTKTAMSIATVKELLQKSSG
jgi:5-methylcytosine-specific restriction protein A